MASCSRKKNTTKGVSIVEFKDLGLSHKTLEGLTGMGFVSPTEVQEKTVPFLVSGKEVVARSKTGSGKTVAFGIGIYESLAAGKAKKALVIAPVRELALQIMNELRALGKFHHYRLVAVYGGQDIDAQIKLIYRGLEILIATPGRLLDLFDRGVIDLNEYDYVVLDEADKMFEMGFLEDVEKIVSNTSYARKVQLFSATINEDVHRIASKYMQAYETVEAGEEEKPPDIDEERINIERPQKFDKLVDIIKGQKSSDPTGKILVFVATQRGAEYVSKRLYSVGIDTSFIHGDVRQNRREKIMGSFKEGKSDILVATDVAARGLHVDNISLVVNYDEAMDSFTHLHRIGRTGRMGAKGKAITFVETNPYFRKPSRSGFIPKVGPYNPYAGSDRRPRHPGGPRSGGRSHGHARYEGGSGHTGGHSGGHTGGYFGGNSGSHSSSGGHSGPRRSFGPSRPMSRRFRRR